METYSANDCRWAILRPDLILLAKLTKGCFLEAECGKVSCQVNTNDHLFLTLGIDNFDTVIEGLEGLGYRVDCNETRSALMDMCAIDLPPFTINW